MVKLEINGEIIKFNSEYEMKLFCILKGIKPDQIQKIETKKEYKYKFNGR